MVKTPPASKKNLLTLKYLKAKPKKEVSNTKKKHPMITKFLNI